MKTTQTATLWQRYLTHGDDDSFARVFDAEKDIVWTICARYLGAGEDAEEAFQSAWARLIVDSRAGRVLMVSAQESLCRAAGREADALRKRRSRRRARETTMPQPPDRIDMGNTPAASLDEAERRAAIEALVAQLPDKLRLPVQLYYLNGMTQRQVAATLDVPPSTIDSRLKAALEKLRPLAERAGLREALGVLVAGGMGAGLLTTPTSLTAASVLGASATTTVAAGFLGTTTAKIAAVAAVVVLTVGIGMSVLWPADSTDLAAGNGNRSDGAYRVDESAEAPSVDRMFVAGMVEEERAAARETRQPEPANAETEEVETVAEEETAEVASAAIAPAEEKEKEPETRFLSLLVLDAQSGAPIAGAEGRVRAPRYNHTITTDAEGIARLDDVPLGQANISASATGYALANLLLDVGSTDPVVTMELRPGSVLYGIVQDESGTPIPEAKVTLSNTMESWNEAAISDAEGRYEIHNVARGIPLHQVYVNHPGYKTYFQHQKVIVPESADRHEHNIVLIAMSSASLTGIVVDAITGRPIANARLRASQQMRDEPIGHTNAAGRFAIENFTLVNNQILFVADGYAPQAVNLDTVVDGHLRVGLERGLVASGILVDEEDDPIENVGITVWAESMHNIASATTGADGRFRIADLDSGAVFWVTPPWQTDSMRYDNMAGKTNERIVIPRYSPVAGRVVDAGTGKPVEQFRVRLGFPKRQEPGDAAPRGILTRLMEPGMFFDTEDGVFRVGAFPPRTALLLTVEAEGYATAEIDRVIVNPEGEPIVIRMKR